MIIQDTDKIISTDEILKILKEREQNSEKLYTFEEAYYLGKKYISNLGKNV